MGSQPHPPTPDRDDRGASAVEYALVLTLISLALILGASTFGVAVGEMFNVSF